MTDAKTANRARTEAARKAALRAFARRREEKAAETLRAAGWTVIEPSEQPDRKP